MGSSGLSGERDPNRPIVEFLIAKSGLRREFNGKGQNVGGLALLCAFLIVSGVACGADDDAARGQIETPQAQTADGGIETWPESVEPILADTTKVVAEEARLENFGSDGTLTFSGSTDELDSLQPGDVVVSGVTEAAPAGYLRRVASVRFEDGNTIVETEPASLTDALKQGRGGIATDLRVDSITSTDVLAPGITFSPFGLSQNGSIPEALGSGGGVFAEAERADLSDGTLQARAVTAGLMADEATSGSLAAYSTLGTPKTSSVRAASGSRAIQAGDAGFTYKFTKEWGNAEAGAQVAGYLSFKPSLQFDVWISSDEDWEIPDLNIYSELGATETAWFTANAWAEFEWKSGEIPIAAHTFAPITFSIGPLPVVITPKLTVYVRADGSLSASVEYRVDQSLGMTAGFSYNSDTGFKRWNDQWSDFSDQFSFGGRFAFDARAGVDLELLLYGGGGPYARLEAGPKFRGNFEGFKPAGELLRLDGCLYVKGGLRANESLLDISKEWELYTACTLWWHVENMAPKIGQEQPIIALADPAAASIQTQPGGRIVITPSKDASGIGSAPVVLDLRAEVTDTTGQLVECTWTGEGGNAGLPDAEVHQIPLTGLWDDADVGTGSIMCGDESGAQVTLGDGKRTLTLTVTDGANTSGSAGDWSSESRTFEIWVRGDFQGSTWIDSPKPFAVLDRDMPVDVSGGAAVGQGGKVDMTYRWTLTYPTDMAGTAPEGTPEYEIGNQPNFEWVPSLTATSPLRVSDRIHFENPPALPCEAANEYGLITLYFSSGPGFESTPTSIVVGFANPGYEGGKPAYVDGKAICIEQPGADLPGTTTTTLPLAVGGSASISAPQADDILPRDKEVQLSGSITPASAALGATWVLEYPTTALGGNLSSTSEYTIGTGLERGWIPELTEGLVFENPLVGNSCAKANEYGVLVLKVRATGAGVHVEPDSIVIGFANPAYIHGPLCGGGLQPTTTTTTTTPTTTPPTTATTVIVPPPTFRPIP